MFTLVINEGLGFTECRMTFSTIAECVDYAKDYDNVKIYKGNKRIY